jgi:hypothetical protein
MDLFVKHLHGFHEGFTTKAFWQIPAHEKVGWNVIVVHFAFCIFL